MADAKTPKNHLCLLLLLRLDASAKVVQALAQLVVRFRPLVAQARQLALVLVLEVLALAPRAIWKPGLS